MGRYYALSALSALVKYAEVKRHLMLPHASVFVRFQPLEGTCYVDIESVVSSCLIVIYSSFCAHKLTTAILTSQISLELAQNAIDARSRHSLYGLLNHTVTPGGARLLKSSILSPVSVTSSQNVAEKHRIEVSFRTAR